MNKESRIKKMAGYVYFLIGLIFLNCVIILTHAQDSIDPKVVYGAMSFVGAMLVFFGARIYIRHLKS